MEGEAQYVPYSSTRHNLPCCEWTNAPQAVRFTADLICLYSVCCVSISSTHALMCRHMIAFVSVVETMECRGTDMRRLEAQSTRTSNWSLREAFAGLRGLVWQRSKATSLRA